MAYEEEPSENGLTLKQQQALRLYLQTNTYTNSSFGLELTFETKSRQFREMTDRLGVDLADERQFYGAMAGVSTATIMMQELMEAGYEPQFARMVIRTAFARMHPGEPS